MSTLIDPTRTKWPIAKLPRALLLAALLGVPPACSTAQDPKAGEAKAAEAKTAVAPTLTTDQKAQLAKVATAQKFLKDAIDDLIEAAGPPAKAGAVASPLGGDFVGLLKDATEFDKALDQKMDGIVTPGPVPAPVEKLAAAQKALSQAMESILKAAGPPAAAGATPGPIDPTLLDALKTASSVHRELSEAFLTVAPTPAAPSPPAGADLKAATEKLKTASDDAKAVLDGAPAQKARDDAKAAMNKAQEALKSATPPVPSLSVPGKPSPQSPGTP